MLPGVGVGDKLTGSNPRICSEERVHMQPCSALPCRAPAASDSRKWSSMQALSRATSGW